MQCPTPVRRAVCGARNAYRPGRALLAAFFATSVRCHNTIDSGGSSHYSKFDHLLSEPTKSPPSKSIRKGHDSDNEQRDLSKGPQNDNPRVRKRFEGVWKLSLRSSTEPEGSINYSCFKERSNSLRCNSWQTPNIEVSNRDREYEKGTFPERTLAWYKTATHYEPRVIDTEELKAKHIPPAWPLPDFEKASTATRGLNREIRDFAAYMEITPVERIARQAATDDVLSFLEKYMSSTEQGFAFEVFGSEKSGLALPVSDIDIRMNNPNLASEEQDSADPVRRGTARKIMQSLMNNMRMQPKLFSNVSLRMGQNILINCTHVPSGVAFQIVASKASDAQEAVTRKFLAKMTGLKEVFIVVRTFFDMRRLISVYDGSLGSYSIFIMLVASLARPNSDKPARDLVGKLMRFLRFYDPTAPDNNIDTTIRGVACYPPYTFRKHDQDSKYSLYSELAAKRGDLTRAGRWAISQRSPLLPDLLCIQDPANPYNDLGRTCRAIRYILATIVKTRASLDQQLHQASQGKTYTGSLLTTVVGRPDVVYAQKRMRLKAFGEAVIRQFAKEDRQMEHVERGKRKSKARNRNGKFKRLGTRDVPIGAESAAAESTAAAAVAPPHPLPSSSSSSSSSQSHDERHEERGSA